MCKEKIYCKNCRFQNLKDADGYFIPMSAGCCMTKKQKNEITGCIDWSWKLYNPMEKNKNNNCKDYVKLWWKFWVRC